MMAEKENKVASQEGMKNGEIDLIELAKKIWGQRKLIGIIAGVFMLAGIIVAYVSPKKYTAQCVVVPQTGGQPMGNHGGLAAMAGINLGSMGMGGELSPEIYPNILASVPFQKELMHTMVDFEEKGRMTIMDYFNMPESEERPVSTPVPVVEGVEELSGPEAAARGKLSEVISLVSDQDLIPLSVTMSEPVAAAQIAVETQRLLQKYVTKFKTQKTQTTLDFVEIRAQEAQEELEKAQQAYAEFMDRNRNVSTQTGIARSSNLKMESNLAGEIYGELARQREQLKIKVKEETPVFTIIEPVTVPLGPSAPKRKLIIAGFTFAGILLSAVWALFRKG